MNAKRRLVFLLVLLFIGVAGPSVTGCSRKPAPSHEAKEALQDRRREDDNSKRRTEIVTGPWEWRVTSFEFADSYTPTSSSPVEPPRTITAKDSQHKLAIARIHAKPIREYTSDETASMKNTYVGQSALAYAKPFGANKFLATRCFLLGDARSPEQEGKQGTLTLTPCQVLTADKSTIKGGISFETRDTFAAHVEIIYAKDDPVDATLVFSNVPADGNPILFFHPIPAGTEFGKTIGAAHLTLASKSLSSVEYGDLADIKRWFPRITLDSSRSDDSSGGSASEKETDSTSQKQRKNELPAPNPDTLKPYVWLNSTNRSGFILDSPGSRNMTLNAGKGERKIEYAGLTFTQKVTVSILKDGTLVATKEGVIGVDAKGGTWVSRKAQLDGEQVIAFFQDSR